MYVTRKEVVDRIDQRLEHAVPIRVIEKVVLALEAEITDRLVAGEDVVLLGFGKFETRQRRQHSAPMHEPGAPGSSSERIVVLAHRVARFVPGSKLRAAVR